jgi:hypothetical protein
MRNAATVFAAFAVVASTAPVSAQGVKASSAQAHWQFGVVELALKADLPDPCMQLGRTKVIGVQNRVLSVDIVVLRQETPQCRAASGSVTRDYSYNFAGITPQATAVAVRFVRDGQDVGRETVPIGVPVPLPR